MDNIDRARFLKIMKEVTGLDKDEIRQKISEGNVADLERLAKSRDFSLSDPDAEEAYLLDYVQALENHRENAEKINRIQNNFQDLENMFDTLKNEIGQVFDDTIELEGIAAKLDDSKLEGELAQYEDTVEYLNKKLKHLVKIKKEMEQRESKLQSLTENINIESALNQRMELVEIVISEIEASDDDWTHLIHSKNFDQDNGWWWNTTDPPVFEYENFNTPNDIPGQDFLPSQHWKIHVSVDPNERADNLEIGKTLIQVLQGERCIFKMKESVDDSFPDTKMMTIYPMPDLSKLNQISAGNNVWQNLVNINKDSTEHIVGIVANSLASENLLEDGPEITTDGEFRLETPRGDETRLHLRYAAAHQNNCSMFDAAGNEIDSDAYKQGHKPSNIPGVEDLKLHLYET